MHWRPYTLISTNLWNNSGTSFSLKFVNMGDKETKFAKDSVSIILAVYLGTAKIYIGPKRVRGLKRLGNTVLDQKCKYRIGSSSSFVDLHWIIPLSCTSQAWLPWKITAQLFGIGVGLLAFPPSRYAPGLVSYHFCNLSKEITSRAFSYFYQKHSGPAGPCCIMWCNEW